jgi:hypothetical protein
MMTFLFGEDPALFPDEPNYMVRKNGYGPKGKTCKTCHYLIKTKYHGKVYYKCDWRGITASAASDIRLKWNACRLYEEQDGIQST